MKHFLLLCILLTGSLSFAQENTSLKFETTEQARAFADSMMSLSEIDHQFLKEQFNEKQRNLRFYYFPSGLADAEKEFGCPKCTVIDFAVLHIGADKDLKIEGTLAYSFKKFKSAEYLTIYPAWQKYFNADAEKVSTLKEYKNTTATLIPLKIWLQSNNDGWNINNYDYWK